jgi:hypothetical protein
MGLTGIRRAIEELSAEQQARLAVWLSERDRLHWDFELGCDFPAGGAGMALLERAKARVERGESEHVAEGRRRR